MAKIDARELGFSVDPDFDNAEPWNAWVNDLSQPRWVEFDGNFWFKSKPDPVERAVALDFAGINISSFVRDYVPASQFERFLHFKRTATIRNLVINATKGTTGVAVCFEGLKASASLIHGGWISARNGAQWAVPVILDGTNQHLGIRSVRLYGMEIFAANVHLMWLLNVRGADLHDVNCYPAAGTVDHVTIQHNNFGSETIHWQARYLTEAWVYQSTNIVFECNQPVKVHTDGGCLAVRQK